MNITKKTFQTVSSTMLLGMLLWLPAHADKVCGAGNLEENVGYYPEANVQRYVISKGKAVKDVLSHMNDAAVGNVQDTELTPDSGLASDILRLTNDVRRQHGLAPVGLQPALQNAAIGHSAEMLALNYFSHTSPTPGRTSPVDRVREAGASPMRVSENLFYCEGYPVDALAPVVIDSWLQSPGHRANLLDPQVTHMGLGVVEKNGTVSITQVFGGGLR